MVTIAQIDRWRKQGQDYTTGVELLSALKQDHPLLGLLKSGQSSFTERKLYAVLEEIWQNMPTPIVEAAPQATQPQQQNLPIPTPVLGKKIDWEGMPRALQNLHPIVKDLLSRRAYLHSQLMLLPTDEQRCQNVKEIVNITIALRLHYDKIDYWLEHHELLPDDQTPAQANRSLFEAYKEKLLRQKTAKEFISRNKKINPEAAELRQKELDELIFEIEADEKRLHNATAFQI